MKSRFYIDQTEIIDTDDGFFRLLSKYFKSNRKKVVK